MWPACQKLLLERTRCCSATSELYDKNLSCLFPNYDIVCQVFDAPISFRNVLSQPNIAKTWCDVFFLSQDIAESSSLPNFKYAEAWRCSDKSPMPQWCSRVFQASWISPKRDELIPVCHRTGHCRIQLFYNFQVCRSMTMFRQVFNAPMLFQDVFEAQKHERRQISRNLKRMTLAASILHSNTGYFVTICRLLSSPWILFSFSDIEKNPE